MLIQWKAILIKYYSSIRIPNQFKQYQTESKHRILINIVFKHKQIRINPNNVINRIQIMLCKINIYNKTNSKSNHNQINSQNFQIFKATKIIKNQPLEIKNQDYH